MAYRICFTTFQRPYSHKPLFEKVRLTRELFRERKNGEKSGKLKEKKNPKSLEYVGRRRNGKDD